MPHFAEIISYNVSMTKHKHYFFWLIVVLLVCAMLFLVGYNVTKKRDLPRSSNSPAVNVKNTDSSEQSLDDPSSTHIIVNKHRQLSPKTYEPSDLVTPNVSLRRSGSDSRMKLRKEAASALQDMFAQAKNENIDLVLSSGYRSYTYQEALYNGYVSKQGQAEADSQSARPGYSEHQTGLAADIAGVGGTCELEACFADTKEGKWLESNAYKYGFVIRYSEGQTAITGYVYEPWHIRYIGKDTSSKVQTAHNIPLETYFGLEPAPSYK